ncbi:DUF5689 domain-containing protein [Parapedobacter deserti]|uniref:DUF5689 domain-containing protein n=1 Tax=Parapedobacter deserti TaxID=1912957 RepID=A0ABV7JPL2_9SPHI
MKSTINKLLTLFAASVTLAGCYKTELNYPGGVVSPYIAIYDVRNLYKGAPLTLDQNKLGGSAKIACVVVSDHRAGNLPQGLLIVQNKPRLDFLRGLAVSIGDAAGNYLPGDSLVIDLVGSRMERVDGILQVTNITTDKIEKVDSGKPVPVSRVNIDQILANPGDYESTLLAIVKGGFLYEPQPGQVLEGEQQVTDGFGVLDVVTASESSLAGLPQYKMANYYGIIFSKEEEGQLIPYHKLRSEDDLVELTSVYKTPRIIISGWINDPAGTDANYEYIQFLATEDIDFSETPFSVVTTNNANAAAPTGFPVNGWATGQVRTYKFNITSGRAEKGTFFYVGGTRKMINGPNSTSIADANWVTAHPYNTQDGHDFGSATTNLLANSGNAYGVAVFEGTTVTRESIPEDVMFAATGGSLVGNGYGYRICNNDYYDIINPLSATLVEQPFYRSGTNLSAMAHNTPANVGFFNIFGGEFDLRLGRWTKARSQHARLLTKESALEEIEDPEMVTQLVD